MSHQDKWTRMHDKPTNGIDPSSNNGFIYSAYTMHVAPELIIKPRIIDCVNKCTVNAFEFKYNRSPNKITPPFSRDEVMGLLSLFKDTDYGMELYKRLKANHWNFCNFKYYQKEPLTLDKILTAADALYEIRNEHRNHVWQTSRKEAYCLAFRLPPSDIYYVKKLYGDEPSILETIAFYAETIQARYRGTKSTRMISWLKVMDLAYSGILFGYFRENEKQLFLDYFGKDHVLSKIIVDKDQ